MSLDVLRKAQLILLNEPPASLLEHLRSLTAARPGWAINGTVRASKATGDLNRLLHRLRGCPEMVQTAWAEALTDQVNLLAVVEQVATVSLSIELVAPRPGIPASSSDGFHVDAARRRVICTWVGAGTEWVEDAGVDWVEFGRFQHGRGGRAEFIRPDAPVHSLPAGVPALIRANEWVHRRPWSPEPRLFSIIEP